MKSTVKRLATLVITMALLFTSMPALTGSLDSYAESIKAPAQVKNLKAKNITQSSVTLSWSKIKNNKNTKGYAIYRNGKLKKLVGVKATSFKDTKLKAGTKYKYMVRAYNKYKKKQYYNTKTLKWQAKKPPANQWKWKRTRRITVYKYGKASAIKQVITKKAAKKKSSNNSSENETQILDTKMKMESPYSVCIENIRLYQ